MSGNNSIKILLDRNVRHDVIEHCRGCINCQLRNHYRCAVPIPIQQYPEVALPLDRVHMDLTGELPMTNQKNKYILVVKDFKTKFTWLYPIPNKEKETIVDLIVTKFIAEWGTPKLLVSDKGTEFKNKHMKEVTDLLKIQKINTTPSNPRSNGLVEQHNSTMKDMLSHFVNNLHNDWDEHLSKVMYCYNSTINSITGFTPYYLMFGREMNLSDDIIMSDNQIGRAHV